MHSQLFTSASPGTLSPILSASFTSSFIPCVLLTLRAPRSIFPLHPALALTQHELFGALIYSQYSLHHISTAAQCQGRDRKRRKEEKGNKETGRKKGRGRREDTFVLLIPVLKDTITSHSILSMFYTSPRRHALPGRTRSV